MRFILIFLFTFMSYAEDQIQINLKNQLIGLGESIPVSLEGSTVTPDKGVNGCVYLTNIKDNLALATLIKPECNNEKNKKDIIISFSGLNLKKMEKKIEIDGKLMFLEENYLLDKLKLHYWFILLFILLLIGYLIYRRKRTILILNGDKKFNLARLKRTRKEIEIAYKYRESILEDVENRLKAQQIFGFINKIQFKKDWTEEELDQAYKGLKEFKFRERL